MAVIPITNSQGSKVYIATTANAVVTDATTIATAIGPGQEIGCLQDLGEIGSSRSVQEYSCLSSDNIAKSSGSLSLGNVSISTLFNAADSEGQGELRAIYSGSETRTIIVMLSDNAGANPTYYTFEGFVSDQKVAIQKDNAVMFNSTVEIASNPAVVLAA